MRFVNGLLATSSNSPLELVPSIKMDGSIVTLVKLSARTSPELVSVTRIRNRLVPAEVLLVVNTPLVDSVLSVGSESNAVNCNTLGSGASVKKVKLFEIPAIFVKREALVKFGPFCALTISETLDVTLPANPSALVAVTTRVLVPIAMGRGSPTMTPLLLVRPRMEREEVTPPFDAMTENDVGPLFAFTCKELVRP